MAIYKEAMHWTSDINSNQTQIFKDAADFGVPIVNEETDENIKLVNWLKEAYSFEREVIRFSTGVTVKLTFTFHNEFTDHSEVPCTISYTKFKQPQKCDAVEDKIMGILEIDCPKWFRNFGKSVKEYRKDFLKRQQR